MFIASLGEALARAVEHAVPGRQIVADLIPALQESCRAGNMLLRFGKPLFARRAAAAQADRVFGVPRQVDAKLRVGLAEQEPLLARCLRGFAAHPAVAIRQSPREQAFSRHDPLRDADGRKLRGYLDMPRHFVGLAGVDLHADR